MNPRLLNLYQKKSIENFYLTNKYASNKIDNYRKKLILFNNKNKISKLKILHITNLNEKHNGRLFYNTGRRINNGLIKLNHKVLTLSDRDLLTNYKKLADPTGAKKLNETVI